MATTRLSINGYGTRPGGSFAGKTETGVGHPVGKITRLGLNGHTAQRTGSFAGKTLDAGSGAHPVENITRLGLNGFMIRRGGDFSGREEVIVEPPVEPTRGGGGTEYIRRKGLIEEENAIIMAIIIKFLEVEG